MKLTSVLIAVILTLSPACFGQPSITYSTPFDALEGDTRLLLLNNGATACMTLTDDGISTMVFGADQKLETSAVSSHKVWTDRKFSASTDKGIYNIDGKPVIFRTQLNRGNMLTLHRIIIDPQTAKVAKADELSTIPTRRGYGYTLSELVSNDFYVAHDTTTGNYAVLIFEGYTPEKSDRVKVQVFDNKHNLLKEAFSGATANTQKYTHYAGMCMHNGNVYLATNDYDPKSKSLVTPLYLSVLQKEATEFSTKKIDVRPCNNKSENTLTYNPEKNALVVLTTTETQSELGGNTITKYYQSTITTIDPTSLAVKSTVPFITPKADKYARVKVGDKDGFNGVFPSLHINDDNSVTLVASEYKSYIGVNELNKIGIVYLDDEGKEKDAYVLRIPETSNSIYSASWGFGTRYISTKAGDFVLYNDLPENFDKPENVQPHQVATLSHTNTVLCRLNNGKPQKSYLFGEPQNKRSTKFFFPGSATFDAGTDTYITIMIDNEKGNKKQQVAWVKF